VEAPQTGDALRVQLGRFRKLHWNRISHHYMWDGWMIEDEVAKPCG
jgi:hypothetical protein